jgi:hypothetical protein
MRTVLALVVLVVVGLGLARAAGAFEGGATQLWYKEFAPAERQKVLLGSMVSEAVCEATAEVLGKAHANSGRPEASVFYCLPLQLEAN